MLDLDNESKNTVAVTKYSSYLEFSGDEIVYPVNCPVIFRTSEQQGTNVSYMYNFGYKKKGKDVTEVQWDKDTNDGTTSHLFKLKPDYHKAVHTVVVTIRALNYLSSLTQSYTLKLIQPFVNFTLTADRGNVSYGERFDLLMKSSRYEYKPCYLLEYGEAGGDLILPR